MTKEKQITIKVSEQTALDIRDILFDHQRGYSYEHVPERIVKIRSVIDFIEQNTSK